jgi:hypothetical protein
MLQGMGLLDNAVPSITDGYFWGRAYKLVKVCCMEFLTKHVEKIINFACFYTI